MTITLTREEALQVLKALDSMNGDSFLCDAAHHKKSDWHKSGEQCPVAERYKSIRETLRARLSAPEDIYEEGCTPTDFRVLREANARMAQELFELRSKK